MGKAADKTLIQSRMLNRGKGPAVHSLRAQIDRVAYHNLMKNIIEKQENLFLKQAEITDILFDGGAVSGVKTMLGTTYRCKAAGGFSWFQGCEEIYRNETRVYECVFHGSGALR